MGVNIQTVTDHGNTFEIATYHGSMMGSNSGTFNSVVCSSTTKVNKNERWLGLGLFDGFDDVGQLQMKLPLNYVTGTDVTVIINWHSNVTTGNIVYNVGLGGIDAGTQWAADNDMLYATKQTIAVNGTASGLNSDSWTFNGGTLSLTAGMEIIMVIYRVALTDLNDTLGDNARIMTVGFKYQINSVGTTNAS